MVRANVGRKDVLACPMGPNDAGASTVGDYLAKLLALVWSEDEGFGGKRPFGNSGWKHEVYMALWESELIDGTEISEPEVNYWDVEVDEESADDLIARTIAWMGENR